MPVAPAVTVPLDQIPPPPPADSRSSSYSADNSFEMKYHDGHTFTKTIPPPPPNVAQAIESLDDVKHQSSVKHEALFDMGSMSTSAAAVTTTTSGTRLCTLPNLPLPHVDDLDLGPEASADADADADDADADADEMRAAFDAGNTSPALSSRSASPSGASSAASDAEGASASAAAAAAAAAKASSRRVREARRASRNVHKRSHTDGAASRTGARVHKRRRVGDRPEHSFGGGRSGSGSGSGSALPDLSRAFSGGGGSPLSAPGSCIGGATAGMRLPAVCERRLERPSPFSCGRRSVEAFEIVAQIGEGTYGHVYKARDLSSGTSRVVDHDQ